MPLLPPLAEMLLKVIPLTPIVVAFTLSAVPVVLVIVFAFVPVVTFTVPPPVALNPAPLVVVIARPPLLKFVVAPVFDVSVTPAFVPVVMVLVKPMKSIEPPVLLVTLTPVQLTVHVSVPETATVPAVWPVTLATRPAFALVSVAPTVVLALPPVTKRASPVVFDVFPTEPPLIAT